MMKTRCFDGIIPFSFPPKISEIPSLDLNKKSVSYLFTFPFLLLKTNARGVTVLLQGVRGWDITNY